MKRKLLLILIVPIMIIGLADMIYWPEFTGLWLTSRLTTFLFMSSIGFYLLRKDYDKSTALIEPIVSASERLRMSAEQQARLTNFLDEVKTSTKTINSKTASTLENLYAMAAQTQQKASETKNTSESLNKIAAKSLKDMTDLKKNTHSIGQSVESLKKIITIFQNITHESELLKSLVKKSQLLSINTRIRAEAAGAAGREFDVVASEMNLLALASGEAAARIFALLETSENEIGHIVSDITSDFTANLESTQLVNKSFEDIADAIRQQKNACNHIAQNVNNQVTSIEDLLQLFSSFQLDPYNFQYFKEQIDDIATTNITKSQTILSYLEDLNPELVPSEQNGQDWSDLLKELIDLIQISLSWNNETAFHFPQTRCNHILPIQLYYSIRWLEQRLTSEETHAEMISLKQINQETIIKTVQNIKENLQTTWALPDNVTNELEEKSQRWQEIYRFGEEKVTTDDIIALIFWYQKMIGEKERSVRVDELLLADQMTF
ncbi:MAG: hypothetical protein CMP10_19270 [Zetaproteobacteria bacterium]|nr:hypothetical protein [Pseudobdellovibrionaceae bacterium]